MKKLIFMLLLAIIIHPFFVPNKTVSQNLAEHRSDTSKSELFITSTYPDISSFRWVDKEPVPLKITRPIYPSIALKSGIKGNVYVKVLVDNEGNPKYAVVIKSSSLVLNSSAVCAALKCKFEPAIAEGNKVSYWIVLPYSFR